ncbi:MAG: hypothetical protein JWN88_2545, partial [Frankiales bacterium]|nr:hypothetical protein [Frankiales bacterium]
DEGFEVGASRGADKGPAGSPLNGPVMPVANSPFRTQTLYSPTCTGNGPGATDVLCGDAVNACPTQGDIRFWVYRRTVDSRLPGDNPPFNRVADPQYVCRPLAGANSLDPAVAIAAFIDRDFQQVVVLKGVPEVSPRPDTLVNIPTIFTTSSPPSYDIPLTLLGQSVVITARAKTWTWHFGDGQTQSTSAAGSKGRVEHVYKQAQSRSAHVVIEWTGTFTVNGGPVQQVNGTATTTGDPVAVEVKQARAELVGSAS